MTILHKDPPTAQAKTFHYLTRQRWRPGEPIPKDRQPDAREALERNAEAYAAWLQEQIKREVKKAA